MENGIVVHGIVKGFGFGMIAASAAILYSEFLYQGTRQLYIRGKLQRYYPLPQDRHLLTAWLNALSFTAPVGLWAVLLQENLQRSFEFSFISVFGHILAYMVMHDAWFYLVHTTFHRTRPLYSHFHAMHHEYVYAMNVYMVGYAEATENFIQVGMPWVAWTAIAGDNWWHWFLPFSLVLFTTLLGHSGYRSNWRVLIFYPFILPVFALTGRYMLTAGDHQVHHTYRRYNFGLFWKIFDQIYGTYRKPDIRAYDVHHWTKWSKMQGENSEESRKWMGKHATSFAEVEWGF